MNNHIQSFECFSKRDKLAATAQAGIIHIGKSGCNISLQKVVNLYFIFSKNNCAYIII